MSLKVLDLLCYVMFCCPSPPPLFNLTLLWWATGQIKISRLSSEHLFLQGILQIYQFLQGILETNLLPICSQLLAVHRYWISPETVWPKKKIIFLSNPGEQVSKFAMSCCCGGKSQNSQKQICPYHFLPPYQCFADNTDDNLLQQTLLDMTA